MAAAHIIVNALFESWNERPRVYIIKVNQLVRCNSQLIIAFREIDKTSNIECKVLFPFVAHNALIQITMLLLEKNNPVGRPRHENLALYEVNLSDV